MLWVGIAMRAELGREGRVHSHKPMKAMSNPMPAPTASTRDCGMMRASH
jgi:hypothetical protein